MRRAIRRLPKPVRIVLAVITTPFVAIAILAVAPYYALATDARVRRQMLAFFVAGCATMGGIVLVSLAL